MAHKPVCLVCQKEMELGFMTDMAASYSVTVPRWCSGTPEGWLGNVKTSQFKKGDPVTAYRCPECKALRLYAFDAE